MANTQERGQGQFRTWFLVVSLITATIIGVGVTQAQTQSDFGIQYSQSSAGASGPSPYSEDLQVVVSNENTFEFGPNASKRIRITKTTSGESITLTPAEGENTTSVSEFDVNPNDLSENHITEGSAAKDVIKVEGPNISHDLITAKVSGDMNMFDGKTFAPYVVEVIGSNDETLATTEPRTHGVKYELTGEYNGSVLSVTKDPGVQEDWYVELEQDDMVTEINYSAEDDYFVVKTDGIGFNASQTFDVNIYKNESDDNAARLISLFFVGGVEGSDDIAMVDGPVNGSVDSGESDSTDSPPAVTLTPSTQTAAVGSTVTYDVVIQNADAGVASYEYDLAIGNASVASITDISLAGTAPDDALTTVTTSDDGSTASVSAGAPNIDASGDVTLGTITVNASATGGTQISLSNVTVGDVNADSYSISSATGSELAVEKTATPSVVGDTPAKDLDGDDTYEDINGDGTFDIVDVNAFFQNVENDSVQNNQAQFNFNGQGGVDIVDVNRLFQEALAA